VHFNNYIRLASNVSQWVDDSSTHRLSRANAMGVPTSAFLHTRARLFTTFSKT
jgi:hypothetical protein